MSHNGQRTWLPTLLIAATALLVFAYPLLLDIPLLDPDEGLHASIAQEMVERGDWVTPRLLGKPFLDKPILYFWAEAFSLRLFGMHEAAVRLPGLLFGLLGAVTTGLVGWRLFDRRIGLIAATFYATTMLPTALAQSAAHDVALVPWVNLAIVLFWESERAESVRRLAACAISAGLILGLAILTKGLVGVAIVGLAFGGYLVLTRFRRGTLGDCPNFRGRAPCEAWSRENGTVPFGPGEQSQRQLTPFWKLVIVGAGALALAALVAAGWYVAMEIRNPGYLHYYFVDRHVMGFATKTQTHGRQPFWYYLPILLGGGLPWIVYLPVLGRDAVQRRRAGLAARGATLLLIVWLVGGALFLTASKSKLVTYVWPLFPAMAVLAAIPWSRMLDGSLSDAARSMLARTFRFSCWTGPLVLPAVVLGAQGATKIDVSGMAIAVALLVAFTAWCPLWFWRREQYERALGAAAASIAAQVAVVLTVLLAPVGADYSARDLVRHLNRLGPSPGRIVLMDERIGSVMFYLDPAIRRDLRQDQIVHARLTSLSEWPKADARTLLALPERKAAKVGRTIDLEEVPYESAGRWRVYQGVDLSPRLLVAAAMQRPSR